MAANEDFADDHYRHEALGEVSDLVIRVAAEGEQVLQPEAEGYRA